MSNYIERATEATKIDDQRLEKLQALGFESESDYQEHERVMQAAKVFATKQKVDSIAAGSSAFNGREVGSTHNSGDAFNYQLLYRLKQDCEYYLGHGNRAKKHLWAGDEAEQIVQMKALYAGFSEKPEWISLEDIEQYEAKMLNPIGSTRPTDPSR